MTTTTTTMTTITGLEVPVFSPASAMAALSRGASRLEVNRAGSYPQGGTTPDEAEVAPLSGSPAPLRIMIRPRGPPVAVAVVGDGGAGPDFVYSGAELELMRDAIRRFKACGHLRAERGDGFVFGVLTEGEEGEEEGLAVDVDANRELVRLARPFPCVFHRAFDDVLGSSSSSGGTGPSAAAAERALRTVAACGFDGVLTSGGPGRAADNAGALSLVLRRAPAGLEVIVGGGVRSSNARALRGALLCGGDGGPAPPGGARVWLHSSCLTARSGGEVDEEEVARIVGVLGERAQEA
jgi:copper homeostasis protein